MLEEELGRMNPDMSAIAAFQAKEAEYGQRVSDLEAATAERDSVSSYLCLPCAGRFNLFLQCDHGWSQQLSRLYTHAGAMTSRTSRQT